MTLGTEGKGNYRKRQAVWKLVARIWCTVEALSVDEDVIERL
jgi:hypothetical protein